MVIIAGTGSMGQVMDASGRTTNCGGWGHMFGDGEASDAWGERERERERGRIASPHIDGVP